MIDLIFAIALAGAADMTKTEQAMSLPSDFSALETAK